MKYSLGVDTANATVKKFELFDLWHSLFLGGGLGYMIQWNRMEKRKSPRFEIDIPLLAVVSPDGGQFQAKTHDLSAWGLGAIVPGHLPIGSPLRIEISLSNDDDVFSLQGQVVWVQSLSKPNQYRTGIVLKTSRFNPIPLVLKMLQLKAAFRCHSLRFLPV